MPFLERIKKIVKSKNQDETQKRRGEIKEDKPGEMDAKQTSKKKRSKKTKAPFVRSDIGRADLVISSPLVSEKATDLISRGQYVFKVKRRANKVEVRNAIVHLYGVTVTGIRMITIPSKKRRRGRFQGYKTGYKKAIVRVKKGEQIEVLPH